MTKRPLSPQAAAIVAMSRSSLSRRRLLQVAGITGVAATAAACGAGGGSSDESSAAPSPTQASDLSDSEKFVNWANWPLYIDVNDETGAYPTLEAFTATTGIDVNYTEDVNDNNEFYAKVRAQLEAGQSIDRDIVVLTDWMAALWINNGFAAKFDKALIPNAANLEPAYNGVAFDPNRDYTLPWFSGFGAFGWNKAALQETLGTGSLTSLDQLWDPALKGRITVLSEMRDTMGIIMAWQGADPSNFTDDQYQAGIAELQKQIDSGQIRQVAGNDYVAALETGDVIAVIGWSGDMFQLGLRRGPARERRHAVDGQHAHPVRCDPQEECRGGHELLLRPRRRRRGRRLRPVHLPSCGRQGGHGRHRSHPGRQPVDLPGSGHPR